MGTASSLDEADFTRLYRDTYWRAYAFTRRRIGSDEAARDVVAEAFRIVWQKREVALERGLPYVYATCRNLLGNEYQRHSREASLLGRLTMDAARSGHQSVLELVQVIRRLPADQREVLYLTYWEELPAGDVARILGCSVEAVWKRLSRARTTLRDLLTGSACTTSPIAPVQGQP